MAELQAFLEAIARIQGPRFWFTVAASAIGAVILLVLGFRRLGRARLLEDLPTSRIRSAAQGYVEITGHARWLPGPEIVAPLSGEKCCWWDFKIEKKRERNLANERRSQWVVIDSGASDELFLIDDGTGQCVVDPVGATVVPDVSRRWRGFHPRPLQYRKSSWFFGSGDYRYSERLVRYGSWLYAIGRFQAQIASRRDDEAYDVAELLARWKRDPKDLLTRFDANGDGEIDLDEWELARKAAIRQVRSEQVGRSVQPDLNILNRPRTRQPFILSTQDEKRLTRGLRWGGLGMVVAGFVASLGVIFVLMVRGLF